MVEHAVSFYFALRRNLLGMHGMLADGKDEWKNKRILTSYVCASHLSSYLQNSCWWRTGLLHLKTSVLGEAEDMSASCSWLVFVFSLWRNPS